MGGTAIANRALPPGGGVRPSTISEQLGDATFAPKTGLMNAETAGLADSARGYGITLDPYQVSNSPFLKYLYSTGAKIPFSGAGPAAEAQLGQFTRAVSRTFGQDAEQLTPGVIQDAHTQLGNVFEHAANVSTLPIFRVGPYGNPIINDHQLVGDLQNIVQRAIRSGSAADIPAIRQQAANILRTAWDNQGNLGGRAWLDLTESSGPIADMINSDRGVIRTAGLRMREALNAALQRWAPPDVAPAVQDARTQWKNLKTVEPLIMRADTPGGATPSTGVISPAALRQAVNTSFGDNVVRQPLGAVPLNDLARIGQRFLKEPAQTGTGAQANVSKVVEAAGHAVPGVLTGALGTHAVESGNWKELAALIGTLAANRGAQSVMRMPGFVNRPVRAALNPEGFQFRNPWALGALSESPSGMWLPGQRLGGQP
jgi:hypothetical protein